MNTLDATVSMLETIPKPANPFTPKSKKDILDDLTESREQIADGKGVDMKQALQEMGAKHSFI